MVTKILDSSDGLQSPKGLAVSQTGDLYIADTEASAIFRYSSGRLSLAVQGIGRPEEIAIDRDETLYVTQEVPPVVFKVKPGEKPAVFADETTGLGVVESIATWHDHVYVGDSIKGLLRFQRSQPGTPVTLRRTLGPGLEGVAVDEDGTVFVGIRQGRRSRISKVTEKTPD